MAVAPQLAWPLELTSQGVIRTVPQDSDEELKMSMEIALRYEPGTRRMALRYGVPSQLFRQSGPDLGAIRAALAESEPRVETNPELATATIVNYASTIDLEFDARAAG